MKNSEQDNFLCRKTEEAIHNGSQLYEWCLLTDKERNLTPFPLDLKKKFRLYNRAEGYFSSLNINGQMTTVMGCRQEANFGQITGKSGVKLLDRFVIDEFLPRAHWRYKNGSPGGFTILKSLYKNYQGEYHQFAPENVSSPWRWEELKSLYNWIFLTIHIHDFSFNMGPFHKRIKEAACVVIHPGFIRTGENPSELYTHEISIGYPFVDFAPLANFFGFGPGKFRTAIKTYTFLLNAKNEITVRMEFAAAPRCERVFDFGKHIPDPLYGGAALLNKVTFGKWNPERFHHNLDAFMLATHCRVHQSLLDGSELIWREWLSREAK